MLQLLPAAALILFALGAPLRNADVAPAPILGRPPGYGPMAVTDVPNAAGLRPRIWVPGLDDGFDPQGLAFAGADLFVSGYRSDSAKMHRGPCRIYRIDPAAGRETGHVEVPPPCGHAGGLASDSEGTLYVADTHSLFLVTIGRAFDGEAASIRPLILGADLKGALAASGRGEIWIGSYEENRPGKILRFAAAGLRSLPAGSTVTADMATASFQIPTYAQGAAFDADGRLWVARSELAWGYLERLDLAGRHDGARYAVAGGIEGLAIDPDGRLWAVSEAGSHHLTLWYPFFPLIFGIDTTRIR
ncbi:MAG: hypothetical protein JO305_06995 [Alphaproteobacteria bacterium]|nr:hypothetical protein [Alphaproteobacteria bacterium]